MTDLQNKTSDVSNEPYAAAAPPPAPQVTPSPPTFETDVKNAVKGAVDVLVSLQDPAGWWKGELETNVTMDAEDLLLREFLGVRTEEQTVGAAKWIRSQQRDDGTWANFYGGPPELSTTIEAYVALRLAGDAPESEHMVRAQKFIQASGGIESSRVFTRIWLALFDLWPWSELPVIPAELMFRAASRPPQHLRLRLLGAPDGGLADHRERHRPTHQLSFRVPELRSGVPAVREKSLTTWAGRFHALDRLRTRLRAAPASITTTGGPASRRELDRGAPRGRRFVGRHSAAVGLLAHRPSSSGVRTRSSRDAARASRGLDGFTIEDERGRRLRPASHPSGTRPWRSPRWPTPDCRRKIPFCGRPLASCSVKRSPSRATGRCDDPNWSRAGGPLSSRTTPTPTSTTRPRSSWLWVARPSRSTGPTDEDRTG